MKVGSTEQFIFAKFGRLKALKKLATQKMSEMYWRGYSAEADGYRYNFSILLTMLETQRKKAITSLRGPYYG